MFVEVVIEFPRIPGIAEGMLARGGERSAHLRRTMDIHENKSCDIAGKAPSWRKRSEGKHAQLEVHPRKGRNRVPNAEDEIEGCGTEKKTSQEKGRVQQMERIITQH
jgi:hypothetical protein